MIAAACIAVDGILLTRNRKHFAREPIELTSRRAHAPAALELSAPGAPHHTAGRAGDHGAGA